VSDVAVSRLTRDQALAERDTLVVEIQKIQEALGERGRGDADWRKRALGAMGIRQRRLSALKRHLGALRDAALAATAKIGDTSDFGLLASSHALFRRLASEGVDYDEEEQALVDLIRQHVQNGRIAV